MVLSCTCTSRVFRKGPRQMTLPKYFNRIEPSKEERIQSVLPKPDGPLVRLIPCSTTESANSAIREFLLMQGTVDEARQSECQTFIAIFYSCIILLYAI